MGGTMNRSGMPFRILGAVGVVVVLIVVLVHPAGALASLMYQTTPEPTPRPTATPAPYLDLNPTQGVAGAPTPVVATGGFWAPGHTIRLYWDTTAVSLGETQVRGDGTFELGFTTPTAQELAAPGMHRVIAASTDGTQAQANFELIAPPPTDTPTPITPSPTNTWTHTPPPPLPTTPTPTRTSTPTTTPSPTLRPVTPMVTITPIPPTKAPTSRPRPTRTHTPVPGTPTATRTPTHTPGPGTPSVTPKAPAEATATPVQEISDTGGGWGTVFLWGFVLASLLVVFRLLRVRSLQGK